MVFLFLLGRRQGEALALLLAGLCMAFVWSHPIYAQDQTPPTLQITPNDDAREVAVDAPITITFSESVKMEDHTALSSAKARGLFTFTHQDSGSRVDVSVSWNAAKKMITIKPVQHLAFGTTYQLTFPADKVKDRAGNGNLAAVAQFTTEQAGPPLDVQIYPGANEGNVPVDSFIHLLFNEPVERANKTAINDEAIEKIVKLTDAKGKRVDFTGSWNSQRRTITLDPTGNLANGATYTITLLENKLIDHQGEKNREISSRFTTRPLIDTIPPTVTVNPAHGSMQVPLTAGITLQFAEEVQHVDGTPLSSKTCKELVKLYDERGSVIKYSATYNKSKRMMTIKPKGGLQRYMSYTVLLPACSVADLAGQKNLQVVATFVTGEHK